MSDGHPVLPPFDASSQTLEEAVQEQLDFGAQLKRQSRQLQQLAERQAYLDSRFSKFESDVSRIADGQTACNGNVELILSRLRKLTKHLGAPE